MVNLLKTFAVVLVLLTTVGCESDRDKSDRLVESARSNIRHYFNQRTTMYNDGYKPSDTMEVWKVHQEYKKEIELIEDDYTLQLITYFEMLESNISIYQNSSNKLYQIDLKINDSLQEIEKKRILEKRLNNNP